MKKIFSLILIAAMLFCCTGCGPKKELNSDIPSFEGLKYKESVEIKYATEFRIYRYEGGYSYIRINGSDNVMIIPESGTVPEDLPEDTVLIHRPVFDIYIAATSSMALFDAMNALDTVRFSSLETGGWAVENVNNAMREGKIIYAGKYSAPDYELLLGGDCRLAVESTMISHSPEVKEKLEELGIPVIVERSSYENHPLGRTEWVKFFGEVVGKQDEAKAAFDLQAGKVEAFGSKQNTGKTVAFFYINSRGSVVTYKGSGYVPAMIELAGGEYILADIKDDSKLSTLNMSMEQFYDYAENVDIIIYNSSIMSELSSLDQFLSLSSVLSDFKAVKDGNVWCTSKSMFQETDKMGSIIEDMHKIIYGEAGNGEALNHIRKLN